MTSIYCDPYAAPTPGCGPADTSPILPSGQAAPEQPASATLPLLGVAAVAGLILWGMSASLRKKTDRFVGGSVPQRSRIARRR